MPPFFSQWVFLPGRSELCPGWLPVLEMHSKHSPGSLVAQSECSENDSASPTGSDRGTLALVQHLGSALRVEGQWGQQKERGLGSYIAELSLNLGPLVKWKCESLLTPKMWGCLRRWYVEKCLAQRR